MHGANKNTTLFVVDDEPNMLIAIKRALRDEPYDIHTFTSPREALEKLNVHEVGVIVTDQCMPDMAGDELLAAATQLQPNIEGIIVTGYSPKSEQELAASTLKITSCMKKPFAVQELRTSIADAFQRYNKE